LSGVVSPPSEAVESDIDGGEGRRRERQSAIADDWRGRGNDFVALVLEEVDVVGPKPAKRRRLWRCRMKPGKRNELPTV